jgi:hypothetical protein
MESVQREAEVDERLLGAFHHPFWRAGGGVVDGGALFAQRLDESEGARDGPVEGEVVVAEEAGKPVLLDLGLLLVGGDAEELEGRHDAVGAVQWVEPGDALQEARKALAVLAGELQEDRLGAGGGSHQGVVDVEGGCG